MNIGEHCGGIQCTYRSNGLVVHRQRQRSHHSKTLENVANRLFMFVGKEYTILRFNVT